MRSRVRARAVRRCGAAQPACASLDMFRNDAHRAEVFVKTVGELADAALEGELGMSRIAADAGRGSRDREARR